MTLALVDRLRALSPEDRSAILSAFSARQLAALKHAWRPFWARPDVREAGAIEGRGQLAPPGNWTWWASIGGRGSGKTRTCAEWINDEAMRLGRGCIIHLVGATIDDAQATMVEGQSGLLAIAPPWAGIDYKVSKHGGRLTWRSGARARIFGADKPSKGRGPQCNRMWLDDPAAFGPHGKEVLDQLLFGFRIHAPDGSGAKGVISSTPIESALMDWVLEGAQGGRRSRIVYSYSITDDNRSNLTDDFFEQTIAEFAGTELEQQERFGILDKKKQKVFAGVDFNATRVLRAPERFMSVAVWVDPSISSSTKSCEVGIVAAGIQADGHLFILEDLSGVLSANEWPERAIEAVEKWTPWTASIHLGVETNRGGNMPAELLRSAEVIRRLKRGEPGISVHEIRTVFTDKGKAARATPLPRLYNAKQVHHVGAFDVLEKQLRELDDVIRPGRDRADAAVYCVLDLVGILPGARPGEALPFGGGAYPVGDGVGDGPAPLGSVSVGAAQEVRVPYSFGVPGAAGSGRR